MVLDAAGVLHLDRVVVPHRSPPSRPGSPATPLPEGRGHRARVALSSASGIATGPARFPASLRRCTCPLCCGEVSRRVRSLTAGLPQPSPYVNCHMSRSLQTFCRARPCCRDRLASRCAEGEWTTSIAVVPQRVVRLQDLDDEVSSSIGLSTTGRWHGRALDARIPPGRDRHHCDGGTASRAG
jgi:hypothetical protein